MNKQEESDFDEFDGLKADDDDPNLEIKELSSWDEIIDIYDSHEDDVKVEKLKIDNEEFKLLVNKPRRIRN